MRAIRLASPRSLSRRSGGSVRATCILSCSIGRCTCCTWRSGRTSSSTESSRGCGRYRLGRARVRHLRRDLGPAPAVLFSFLCFFTPYIALMAVEIRMYSWATFFRHALLRLCDEDREKARFGISLGRMVPLRRPRAAPASFPLPGGRSSRCRGWRVRTSTISGRSPHLPSTRCFLLQWCGLSCVARSAEAFSRSIFASLSRRWRLTFRGSRPFSGQVGVVSNTYWANFVFPATLIELAAYPVLTSPLSFAIRGFYGTAAQVATVVGLVLLCVAILAGVVFVVLRRAGRGCPRIALRHTFSSSADDVRACLAGFAVYAVVLALGVAASVVMGSLILYYRYLFVAVGPLLVGLSVLLAREGACRAFCRGGISPVAVLHQSSVVLA